MAELRRLTHFDVYEVVDECEATGQKVDAKWVDRQRGDKVRSRIVARQFATNLWSICLQLRQTPQY